VIGGDKLENEMFASDVILIMVLHFEGTREDRSELGSARLVEMVEYEVTWLEQILDLLVALTGGNDLCTMFIGEILDESQVIVEKF
jgi:hypothetical protein